MPNSSRVRRLKGSPGFRFQALACRERPCAQTVISHAKQAFNQLVLCQQVNGDARVDATMVLNMVASSHAVLQVSVTQASLMLQEPLVGLLQSAF